MKLNIQQTDMEPIRRLLTCADSNPVIAVGSEDVDNLFDSATALSLNTSRGDNFKDALQKLDAKALDCEKASKAIFVVYCSKSYQMPASELADLNRYINHNLPKADAF